MPPTDCPSATDLIAFHLGNLPVSRQDALAEHVEGCAACERKLDELDDISDDALDAVRATATGPPAVVAPLVLTGKRVGEYEVLEEIGRGGMGLVCRARHGRLRRVVALKMLLSGEFASADYRARFLAESVAVARLRHPNIVQIYEVGEATTDGGATVPFLALEYVEGGSLAERVGERPQPPMVAAGWVETLALAVQHAHEQGVIHRDLKPSNVLMTADGQPKLCDFGVAKVLAGPDLRTRSGLLVGTPEYMAPEQAAGQARLVSPASDVWALGAILYSLLTGRPPFAAPEPLSVLRMVQTSDPLPPRRLQPSVPRDLETVCLRCLHKDPRRRYASARELADDLARFRQGRSVLARPTGMIEQGWKWLRRRPGAAALLLSLTLLVTVGLPLVTVLWLQAESARRRADASLEEAEASLYFNQVALAQQGMENGDASQARLMLRRCVPDDGRPDRRGLEWRYLQQQAYPGLFPSMWRRDAQAEQWVHEVSWSPDGKRLISAAGLSPSDRLSRITPGEVRVWDATTGACEARLTTHTGSVLTVAWHPDGRSFVTGGADGKVFRWDITPQQPTPERLGIPVEDGDIVSGLRYSPDGKRLAVGTGRVLILWDATAGRALHTFPGGMWGARTLGFHAGGSDGTRLFLLAGQAAPNNEAPLRRWDVTGPGAPVAQIAAGPPTPCNVAAVGAGVLVVARDRSSELEVWDADGTQLRERLRDHQAQVLNASLSGGTLASASDDGTVRLWDLATGKRTAVLRGHTRGVMSVAFSPDGSRLASGDKFGFVCLWDAARDPRGAHFAGTQAGGGEYLGALAFADGGATVVTVSQLDNRAFLFDLAAGRRTAGPSLPLSQSAFNPRRDQAFSPDGRRLLAPDPATPTTAKVWDVRTGDVVASLEGHESKVILVAWSGDGRTLATVAVSDDAKPPQQVTLRVWDAQTKKETARWPIEGGMVTSLALSRDGGLVAAARRERDPSKPLPASAALVYDRDGKELHRLVGGVGVFAALAFRPDGGQLAAAGYHAGRVYSWDLGLAKRFVSRDSLTVPTSVAYSPDGERLAAGCFDNRVRLWESRGAREAITLTSLGPAGSGNYNYTSWVVFSPDGRRLAANDWKGGVSVWDAPPLGDAVCGLPDN